ncbi:hypothetical protein KCU99_g139, partial [Aureobasidium melanogenum]
MEELTVDESSAFIHFISRSLFLVTWCVSSYFMNILPGGVALRSAPRPTCSWPPHLRHQRASNFCTRLTWLLSNLTRYIRPQ